MNSLPQHRTYVKQFPDADTQALRSHLHRGAAWGFLQTFNGGPTGDKRRSIWVPTEAQIIVPQAWRQGHNLYFGVNPSTERREEYQASTNETIGAINCLYAEFDGKDFTCPSELEIGKQFAALRNDPAKAKIQDDVLWKEATGKAQELKFLEDTALYKALALAHVQQLTPAPSVVWDSGGGYQAVWLLAETFHIHSDEDREKAKDWQARWVMFVGGDPGAKDLRRVLRLPGSRNYKKRYAPNFPLVSYISFNLEQQYTLAELVALLPEPVREATLPAPSHRHAVTERTYTGESVIDTYNNTYRIEDELARYNYTRHGSKWSRPGEPESKGVHVFADENASYHHSSNDPMFGEHIRRPFDFFLHFEHNGDVKAAVREAARLLGMDYKPGDQKRRGEDGGTDGDTPKPEPKKEPKPDLLGRINRVRHWLQHANFAELVPHSLQSATGYRTLARDKAVASAYLDIFQSYGRLQGPVSQPQLMAKSGKGSGAVQKAQKVLQAIGFIKLIPSPEGSEGAYWWMLGDSCVNGEVYNNTGVTNYFAVYATIFTGEKAKDAWQRNPSKKRQYTRAKIKAFGPNAVLVADALFDYGQQTPKQLGQVTHLSKYSISRVLAIFEDNNLVDVEKRGREKLVSLKPEFLATVRTLEHDMTTYGRQLKRELSLALRQSENCAERLIKGIGDSDTNAERLDKADERAINIIEQQLDELYSQEVADEKMRRILLALHRRRNQAIERVPQRLEVRQMLRAQGVSFVIAQNPELQGTTKQMIEQGMAMHAAYEYEELMRLAWQNLAAQEVAA